MIRLSATARQQVRELTAHYRKSRRPEAIRNLITAVEVARQRLEAGPRRPREYPATYRELALPGRAWLKEGRYWFAYEVSDPPVIAAVFWDAADLLRRYP